MTFLHPWVLALVLAPLAWMIWVWRRGNGQSRPLLKALMAAAVIAALAEPQMQISDTRVAVAALVDTSRSLTSDDLAMASRLVNQLQSARGSNVLHVIPFAADSRIAASSKEWQFTYAVGESGRATNLEAAVRDGIAAIPSGLVRRLVLISDGNENAGDVTRAAWQTRELGIPIDTFVLAGRPRPELRIAYANVPAQVFSGEQFPVAMTVEAPKRVAVTVQLEADGKIIGVQKVQLDAGETRITLRASLKTVGAVDLAGRIFEERALNASARDGAGAADTQKAGEIRFEQAVSVQRPRVLLVSGESPEADSQLAKAMEASQFEIQRLNAGNAPRLPASLGTYQLLILNNVSKEAFSARDLSAVGGFVRQGSGLLWIAGDRNIYVDRKGAPEDELSRTLPATIAPPRSPEGTCVVLIIDKSSSMEGKKMDLARVAAVGVVDHLRPIDQVGVLIFDNSFQWAVPLRKAEDKTLIKRLIGGIVADGGTQIAPALAEAYRKVVSSTAVYRHIVLLTDGISEEGDSLTLARESSGSRVTISTVGLGQDVNRSYLEKIASYAGGKAYFLNDPSGLEQILLKDVEEHTGNTAVEKPLKAEVIRKADVLEGADLETAPLLRGYVRFTARPGTDTILAIDKKDPLLVRWQHGLGRAAVFTSDAKARWAQDWIGWKGFDRFWNNVARDLLPHSRTAESNASYDPGTGQLTIDYRLGEGATAPAKIPDILAFGPDGWKQPMKTVRRSGDLYRASVYIGNRQGLFRMRPLEESRAFPETGFYRPEAELTESGNDSELLKRIAATTGGRFNPNLNDVYDSGGRGMASSLRLWPGLLGVAILLNLAELFLRKWNGLREFFAARRRARQAVPQF